MSYDEYDAADECNDSLDLGGAEGKPPISVKKMEFSLKQFAKRMGQPNFNAFNKWKQVWVAGVSSEVASVHYPGAETIETLSSWTPALGDGSRRFCGEIRDLAAVCHFQ